MAVVARLETLAELADVDAGDARRMSVWLRHEAVLSDGRRLLLLDDRGWTSQLMGYRADEDSGVDDDVADIWAWTSVEDIEETARVTVGPDEPFDDRAAEDMAADHWAHLADILLHQGIAVDAQSLQRLPHDVVLGDRLRARLACDGS